MNAVIKIDRQITPEEVNRIWDEFLNAERNPEVTQIVLFICSGGGSTDVISTLWEFVKMSKKPVVSIGTAHVASAAASIFMMPSRRILMPDTQFLVHKTSRKLDGFYSVDDMERLAKKDAKYLKVIFASLLANSKVKESVLYKKVKDRDWSLTEEEIEKYGITTEPYNIEEVRKLLLED